ncbi:MAG: hypothetical protein ACFFC3_02850 [Candidatus Odinarchaeota archaeon]
MEAYGDNANDIISNRKFYNKENIEVSLHSKEETEQNSNNPYFTKKKLKKRSKIETLYGITHDNLRFGALRVRSL